MRGLLCAACLLALACDDGESSDPGPPPDGATPDAGAAEDAGPVADAAPAVAPESGLWSLSIEFVEVGNLVLGFQLELSATARSFGSVALRVVDQDGDVSGDLAVLADVPIEGGAFVLDFVDVTLPAEFSPTGQDILATLRLDGSVADADFLCGSVSGAIRSLDIPIMASTFGAVPWLGGLVGPASCDGEAPRTPDLFTPDPRPAAVYLPAGHAERDDWPLVVVLHGYSTNGTLQAAYLGAVGALDALGYVLLVPEGTVDAESNQFWNASAAWASFDPDGVDDVAYLSGLIDAVAAAQRVDRGRVYVYAHSNGAFMGYRLACDGVALAGLVTLAGGEPLDGDACAPAGPVAIRHLHGSEDDAVPIDGRVDERPFPGAAETVGRWAARNGCGAAAAGDPLDLTSVEGAETEPSEYAGCDAPTALWRMDGAGHVPGLNEDFAAQVLGSLLEAR